MLRGGAAAAAQNGDPTLFDLCHLFRKVYGSVFKNRSASVDAGISRVRHDGNRFIANFHLPRNMQQVHRPTGAVEAVSIYLASAQERPFNF